MREWLKASKRHRRRATRGRKGLGEEVAGVDSARSRHAISIFKKKRNREVKAETAGSDEKGRVKMERGKRRSEK